MESKNGVYFSRNGKMVTELSYPIYITDKMCIRLRLYPVEHWISRTSGVLKHLLCYYKSIKLTLKGLISLMPSVLRLRSRPYITLFNIYITKNNISDKKLLFDFFYNNYLDFTKIKNTLYLHVGLLKTQKVNKTDVNIEKIKLQVVLCFYLFY